MLFLPAAALCCLCSALVAMAAEQLIQDDLTLTRRVGENVSFTCRTDQCDDDYVLWFQKRDTETFTVILDINRNSGTLVKDSHNHPQKDDFSAVYEQNVYEQVVKPVVSVYPAASRAHLEGKSSLLCLASAMFPPLVRFSWKRQEENGPLLPAEGEQLELRESGRTAAILLIRQKEIGTYKYRCSVQHQGAQWRPKHNKCSKLREVNLTNIDRKLKEMRLNTKINSDVQLVMTTTFIHSLMF
ncbi:hypothetical protein ABVT39_009081 [Epinephelus coioides]